MLSSSNGNFSVFPFFLPEIVLTEQEERTIIKGDAKSISIAAASVIAKVTRDRIMDELDEKYPMYGFKKHKGYVTKLHLEMLVKYGVREVHRRSFGPVKKFL